MNAHRFEEVNIHEDRLCLEKLDEQIEKAIQELDSLNHTTSRALPKKPTQNHFYPARKNFDNTGNAQRYSYQGYLQLSPENLTQGDPMKELDYSSPQEDLDNIERINYGQGRELNNQTGNLNPFNMLMLNNEIRRQNNQSQENRRNSQNVARTPELASYSRENTARSIINNREISPNNLMNARKSVPSIIEYHGLSNIDLPREKILGNSKPEHYFGSQQNMRRKQNSNSQEKNSSNPQVVDRLLQYGKDRDAKLRAKMEGRGVEHQKRTQYTKPPKVKLSASYICRDDKDSISYYDEGSITKPLNTQITTEENLLSQAATPFHILSKKQSLQPSEITPSQLNQMLGLQLEAKSISAGFRDENDPFYQLYKEGYGNLGVMRNSSEGYLGDRNQSMRQSSAAGSIQEISENMLDNRRSSIGWPGKESAKPQSMSRFSSNVSRERDSRYVTGDLSKSPRLNDSINPSFRPQLSKKSLQIAAKLGNSFQRLMEKNDEKTIEGKKKIMKEIEKELTFKPKINKTSEQLDVQYKANLFNGDDLHRWDQLYLMKDKYNLEKEMKKAEYERLEKMNDECTFQPQLNPVSSRLYRDSSVEIADRCGTWKDFKEKKLEKQRKVTADKELEGCTFQPEMATARSKLASSRSAVNLNDVSQSSVRGLDQHYEKIDRANRLKKEAEARQEKFSGKGWKRQVTIPKGFGFHKRGNSAKPYSRQPSISNLDISAEEKMYRNVLIMESRRDVSPQTYRTRDPVNESWLNKNNGYSSGYNNFGDAIVNLHYELQRMEI